MEQIILLDIGSDQLHMFCTHCLQCRPLSCSPEYYEVEKALDEMRIEHKDCPGPPQCLILGQLVVGRIEKRRPGTP